VVFEVIDNGSGIPDEDVSHLFERYYHKNGAKRKGMGLGLSIFKSIVEAHKGKITIRINKTHESIVSFYVLVDMEEI